MADDLQQTPLHALHVELGAKMVPFAGWDMPVQYKLGVMKEHLHTRAAAGLFDVSHMGQVELRAKSGSMEEAALALESILPVSIAALKPGRQRYAIFTNDEGGILDDLMVTNDGDRFVLVVNAACAPQDIAHLKAKLSDSCDITVLEDRALVALQGPKAEAALAAIGTDLSDMVFMDAKHVDIDGAACFASRTGYTGEDGFEISIPAADVDRICRKLIALDEVEFIGLGARDSLRLEAGLCLYGHDIDTSTTPVEGAIEWAIQKVRRNGGAREGGFPGAQIILEQLEKGASRRRVGLKPQGRAPVREGAPIYADAEGGAQIGTITSGGFGPTVGGPVSMGYVPIANAEVGTVVYAEVRGKRLPLDVSATPFVTQTYKR